jgi:uncharacterized protein (TIGR00288 family)
MSQDRVMLLIDADNLSVDVMEQAVRLLLNQHGGLHVRRAYCTAESAVANQAIFKRLGIKPMVNLAAGKNSTDIAMAVDAIDLVLAERPDVVVIASSDSDFAPLVHRLREKGCVVRGIGQMGKVGDETQDVYDDYTVLEHHKSSARAEDSGRPARKTARKTATRAAVAKKAPAVKKAPAKTARKTASKAVAPEPAAVPAPAPAPAAEPAPTTKRAPRKTAARKSVASRVEAALAQAALDPTAPDTAPAPARAELPAAPAPSRGHQRGDTSVQSVLACLPELAAGQGLALNVAVQRLREAQLLGKNSSSLKLFAQLGDHFDLLPAGKPTQVRLRR